MEQSPGKVSPVGVIRCGICLKPIDLYSEKIIADENGQPVHSECYLNRLSERLKSA
jgi:hypothetical protein